MKFTKLAKTFPAAIRLRRAPDGDWVDAKSVVKVMGLKFRTGTTVELEAEGEAAEAALAELRALVERDFDETPWLSASCAAGPASPGLAIGPLVRLPRCRCDPLARARARRVSISSSASR